MHQPKFGKMPAGERLEQIKRSPNYKDGKFQNLSHTPDLTEGTSYYAVLKEFIFQKSKRNKPADTIPSVKTNLLMLDKSVDTLVWFGHSSYFMQVDGKRLLVDPVLSGAASPIKATTQSFKGSDVYTVDDIPDIDYLFISHDHWDHLDYDTVIRLKPRIHKIVCGLGTGEHLERWGFSPDQLIEKNWNETAVLEAGFVVNFTPARHFSGRGFKRNAAVWVSFVLQTPTLKIFIGGDSGYDSHFAEIGNRFGPFDLAILECGQYDKSWKYIHMMPAEIVQAAQDLKAVKLMPVHWAKFSLANHAWDDPIRAVWALSKGSNLQLFTPLIGEAAKLKEDNHFTDWWSQIN
jgi:L-ascorbate metabolism protein UlaG (beta-lactamase superfamily)